MRCIFAIYILSLSNRCYYLAVSQPVVLRDYRNRICVGFDSSLIKSTQRATLISWDRVDTDAADAVTVALFWVVFNSQWDILTTDMDNLIKLTSCWTSCLHRAHNNSYKRWNISENHLFGMLKRICVRLWLYEYEVLPTSNSGYSHFLKSKILFSPETGNEYFFLYQFNRKWLSSRDCVTSCLWVDMIPWCILAWTDAVRIEWYSTFDVSYK